MSVAFQFKSQMKIPPCIMPCEFRRRVVVAFIVSISCAPPSLATDFAQSVISYSSGSNPANGYTNPLVALGSPERLTGEGIAPGAVTPFYPCFGANEIVSIGAGGQLTLGFNPPLRDEAGNPFGIDFLVFGNSFFTDGAYPSGTVGSLATDGGRIEVSADGIEWFLVPNAIADGLFPTIGSSDAGPYSSLAGGVDADQHKPVDPKWTAQNLVGKSYSELIEIYDGSAGGAGIDLSSVGLDQVIAVRISVAAGPNSNVEIDAVARVRSTLARADTNGDGVVDGIDLATVLSAFGTTTEIADIDHSGMVDGADLAAVLAGWTG